MKAAIGPGEFHRSFCSRAVKSSPICFAVFRFLATSDDSSPVPALIEWRWAKRLLASKFTELTAQSQFLVGSQRINNYSTYYPVYETLTMVAECYSIDRPVLMRSSARELSLGMQANAEGVASLALVGSAPPPTKAQVKRKGPLISAKMPFLESSHGPALKR